MKISLDLVKVTPRNLPFGFCVYGELKEEIRDWANYWDMRIETLEKYTNIFPDKTTIIPELFDDPKIFDHGDFFSPNLNKHLHLGHLSNLIIAKALQSLGIAKNTIAILGDTLDGAVSKEDALSKYNSYCSQFGYKIDQIYFASEQKMDDTSLLDGEDEYTGTKIFKIGENKKVGVKSDGSTSYFYQDVALAKKLNKPTLYLTGSEQNDHFADLKTLFPAISHIGLGLVLVNGKKMSSSDGSVIYIDEILDLVKAKFNNDIQLSWNVLCGHILKYDLRSLKDIKLEQIDNVKTSFGLYLSYTLSRLKSAGMVPDDIYLFNSQVLQYKLIKAKSTLSPNVLFDELVEHCKLINQIYITHHIKDNLENQIMYQPLIDDLWLGMKTLGMFNIDKV